MEWLSNTFGFAEHYRYGEPVSGAQMYLGKAYIMVNRGGSGCATPVQLGRRTQSLTVFVDDVDGHYQRTKSAGGKIVEELHVTCYGERQYGVEDFAGHHWLFSRHAVDVSPEEGGPAAQAVVEIPREVGREALPFAIVLDHPAARR